MTWSAKATEGRRKMKEMEIDPWECAESKSRGDLNKSGRQKKIGEKPI
jgi:hypothetical protein